MNKVKLSEVVDLNGKVLGYAYKNPKRPSKNEIVGVFVGINHNGEARTGWSKCNKSAGDSFDIIQGYNRAFGRAQMNDADYMSYLAKCPVGKFGKQFNRFQERARSYFKDCKMIYASNYTKIDNLGDCQVC